MFEGLQLEYLGGPLSAAWSLVEREVAVLLRTFNPALQLSRSSQGDVDWGRTIARGFLPRSPAREYVLRASGAGLHEDERAALLGWLGWISREWTSWSDFVKAEPSEFLAQFETNASPTPEQLRKWLYRARRSRWPFLREVVAATLRPTIERQDLERIPLPQKAEHLFELLCLVRVASVFCPQPRQLRWLDGATGNKILLPGITVWFQQSLSSEAVVDSTEFGGALARAVRRHNVAVPARTDVVFEFDAPVGGFNGILIEAKSGAQNFGSTLFQLKTYRAAWDRAQADARFLVWGITEASETRAPLDAIARDLTVNPGDFWVFSDADEIEAVARLLMDQQAMPLR